MRLVQRYRSVNTQPLSHPDRDSSGFTRAQREKALSLLESGALLPSRVRPGFYWARSGSDPKTFYLVTRERCTCPAKGRCYHQAAIELLRIGEHPPPLPY